jgi:hypothetical protein
VEASRVTTNTLVTNALITNDATFGGEVVFLPGSIVSGITITLPDPLQSIAGLTTVGDEMLYTIAADTYQVATLTAQGRTFLAQTTVGAQQNVLDLVPGSDIQTQNATLQGIANINPVAGSRFLTTTGTNSFTASPAGTFGITVVGESTSTTARASMDVVQRAPSSNVNEIALHDGSDGLLNTGITVATNNIAGALNDVTAAGEVQGATLNVTSTSQMGGNLTFTSGTVVGLPNPTTGTQAANKTYVDAVAAGGAPPLSPVQFASAAALPNAPTYATPAETLTSTAGAGTALVVDGVTLVVGNNGDRVLVHNQGTATQNGIYTVTDYGGGAGAWQLTRATDFDQAAMPVVAGSSTLVEVGEGGTNDGSTWTLQTTVNDVDPLTDTVTFVQTGTGAGLTEGNGIDIVGNVISVEADGTSLSFTGTTLQVDPTQDSLTLTNSTLDNNNNTVRASSIGTTGAPVVVNTAGPPTASQVLTAINATSASWQATAAAGLSQRLIVDPAGTGDFTTILAAADAARTGVGLPSHVGGAASVTSPIIIEVLPGTYTETNPIVVASFVLIRGTGLNPIATRVIPSVDSDVFQCGAAATVENLEVNNTGGPMTGTAAAFLCSYAPGILPVCKWHHTVARDVPIGYYANGTGAAFSSIVLSIDISAVTTFGALPGTTTDGVLVDAGAIMVNHIGSVTGFFSIASPLAAADTVTSAQITVTSEVGAGVGKTINGTVGNLGIINGWTLSVNDRVLVRNGTSLNVGVASPSNGVYTVTDDGASPGPTVVWTRATDADTAAELTIGKTILITPGQPVTLGGTEYRLDATVGTVDTSACQWDELAGAMTTAYHCKDNIAGDPTIMILFESDCSSVDNGLRVESGSELRYTGGSIGRFINCGLDMDGDALCEMFSALFTDDAGTLSAPGLFPNQIHIKARSGPGTGILRGVGLMMRTDLTSLDATVQVEGAALTTTPGESQTQILGELVVGLPGRGFESVFGEGDSHTFTLQAWTFNGSVLSSVTAGLKLINGSTETIFPTNAIGNILYVGSVGPTAATSPAFLGLKIEIATSAASTTVGAIGGRTNLLEPPTYAWVWEYWDGTAWTEFRIMTSEGDSPYNPHRRDAFNIFGSETSYQIRFDQIDKVQYALPSGSTFISTTSNWVPTTANGAWTQNDPVGLGVNGFWVRIRQTAVLATVPVLSQIKLHTSRSEFNADGFYEGFGNARAIKRTHNTLKDWYAHTNDVPPDEDMRISTRLRAQMMNNQFSNGLTDSIVLVFNVPTDIDTSHPMTLEWRYQSSNNSGGNVRWEVTSAYVPAAGDVTAADPIVDIYPGSGAAPPATQASEENFIFDFPTVSAQRRSIRCEARVNICDMVPERTNEGDGDMIWVAITRLGGADSHSGNIFVSDATILYLSCSMGQHD